MISGLDRFYRVRWLRCVTVLWVSADPRVLNRVRVGPRTGSLFRAALLILVVTEGALPAFLRLRLSRYLPGVLDNLGRRACAESPEVSKLSEGTIESLGECGVPYCPGNRKNPQATAKECSLNIQGLKSCEAVGVLRPEP